ncbi:hypothetical protein DRE_06586 [Drechslerella stenobrocha 248]|uniref:Uncharacterized protein n=1 Tax=Drechslerella stenobrocha 248 TaxID=1043628 RepID=W7I6Y5_9PEZI|nr:hypothetical protein DRE_06586 [Drechslerella stenobrocha 248]
MGWLWSSSKPSDGSKSQSPSDQTNKPLPSLDPSLEEFLKSSTPQEQQPTVPAAQPDRPVPTVIRPSDRGKSRESVPKEYDEPPPRHAQSAYGDRYAEYWATYNGEGYKIEPPDIKAKEYMAGYKQLMRSMKDAAAENCSIEEIELHNCYNHGNWWQKMRMCNEEQTRMSKCLTQQTEFLKALGYLADPFRDPAISEKIQMHADRLYRQQLALDTATKTALKEGRNIEEAVAEARAELSLQSSTPIPRSSTDRA